MQDNLAEVNTNKPKHTFLHVIYIILILGLGSFTYYLYTRPSTCNDKPQTIKETNTLECDKNETKPEQETTKPDKWTTTTLMGAYSFDYPIGWHVANLWPQDYSQAITVAIDPNPINTSPRGGPLAEITILDKAGMDDPDSYLQERIDAIESYYSPYESKLIESDIGDIYYYKGTTNIYEEEYESEVYFLKLQGRIDDAVNTHIIEITRNPFSDVYSDILQEIVLSIKKI